jgi:hypothetical protein
MINNYPHVVNQSFVVNRRMTPLSYALQAHKFNGVGTPSKFTNDQRHIVKFLLDANPCADDSAHTANPECLDLFMACILGDAQLVERIASRTRYINQPSSVLIQPPLKFSSVLGAMMS